MTTDETTASETTTGDTTPPTRTRSHHIPDWDPEDVPAWQAGGHKIARRNLIWSIFAEHIGFSVWSIWSVMVLFMPTAVYHIDAAGKFFLVAMPTLIGAMLRLPYTTAVARFGGRNWTTFSAAVLFVPLLLTLYLMAHPDASYTTFMIVAAFAGFGGGNFASSMTNINAFYPNGSKAGRWGSTPAAATSACPSSSSWACSSSPPWATARHTSCARSTWSSSASPHANWSWSAITCSATGRSA